MKFKKFKNLFKIFTKSWIFKKMTKYFQNISKNNETKKVFEDLFKIQNFKFPKLFQNNLKFFLRFIVKFQHKSRLRLPLVD